MEHNYLSLNCGLKVSPICLGTMTFKRDLEQHLMGSATAGESESCALLDKYFDFGGNFIDTANMYSAGQAEEIIGAWMNKRGNRDDMVVATKCMAGMGTMVHGGQLGLKPNASGLSRKHILSAVEDSLKRLQTDYIDLYQIHCPDPGTPVAETVRTLDDLIRRGKVRYIGACNATGWQMQKLVDTCRELGCNPFVTLQSNYSLTQRTCEPEAFTVCKNEGLGLLPWGCLTGGLLAGKLRRSDTQPPAGSRLEVGTKVKLNKICDNFPDADQALQDDKFWTLMSAMERIAKNHGKTTGQVALRWLLQTPPVTSVIVGATKVQQLEENLGAAAGWQLTEEEMSELTGLTEPGPTYPVSFNAMMAPGRERTGSSHVRL